MILGTAGHIDHGKTALVRALTGVDTDRLPEERRRGITIELGFAPLLLGVAGTVGVVDVPGHDAFVRTMLAGATGIDLALLVIAADEGVMPQTREHLAILTLLGVRGGVVALTKCDLVDDEWQQLVTGEVRDLLAGSPFDRAPIVPCSAESGVGLDQLRLAIEHAAMDSPARDDDDLLRLPVDRAFTVRGTGTVVTGTQWSGSLAVDDVVRLFPSDVVARVRSLESHGVRVQSTRPGNRVAVALGGADRAEVVRGTVLLRDGDPWRSSTLLRADVLLLPDAPILSARTAVRFHLGTSEVGARIAVATRRLEPTPGAVKVPARIALDAPLVARAGDRFVLRSAARNITIGGGVVTDPHPPSRRARPWPQATADDLSRLSWIASEQAGAGVLLEEIAVRVGALPSDVAALVRRTRDVLTLGDRVFSRERFDLTVAKLLSSVTSWTAAHPQDAGLSAQQARQQLRVHPALFDAARDRLVEKQRIAVAAHALTLHGKSARGDSAQDKQRLSAILERLQTAATQPPSVGELTVMFGPDTLALLKLLARDRLAVPVEGDRYYSADAIAKVRSELTACLAAGIPLTVSQIKESLGLTRKYLIPLLEHFDRVGFTRRNGDTRTLKHPG